MLSGLIAKLIEEVLVSLEASELIVIFLLLLGQIRLDESPEFGSIFLLDFAPLIDKMSIFLQEIDPFLRVGRNTVVLVTLFNPRTSCVWEPI